ncbi:MAG: DUF3616 domain-containing protein [Phycisphaerales bacterium]|nr:MAG: DUF3616 domain-containing protein [Phycisphaerales bacterium]
MMRNLTKILFALLTFGVTCAAAADTLAERTLRYRQASDASAAVAIGQETFLLADDENNVLRVYETDVQTAVPSPPVYYCDLNPFLDIEPEHPEADIEGATKVGDRIYWITSHGRNRDGKMRPNRYRFFATKVTTANGSVTVTPIGVPYKRLVRDLISAPAMRSLRLDKVTRLDAGELSKKQRKKLAPKEQGLNIEALCASADGKTIYIGFRNPRPSGKALVVPLENADAVVQGAAACVFGRHILWDLAGLGIRSMEYSTFHNAYFLIAGPHDEKSKFALYRWSGRRDTQPVMVRRLAFSRSDFTPEAIIVFHDSPRFLLLSDDGSLPIKVSNKSECLEGELNDDGTCPNKFLTDPDRKTFRATWLTP